MDPLTATAVAGKATDAVSQVAIAKIQADSTVKIAKVSAQASRYTTSVTEADEILSVLDRPCIRVNIPDPDFSVSMDLSILSLLGGLAAADLYKGYRLNWQEGFINTDGAMKNTDIIGGLAGTIPLDPRALAVLAGLFEVPTEGAAPGSSPPPYAPQPAGGTTTNFFQDIVHRLYKGLGKII